MRTAAQRWLMTLFLLSAAACGHPSAPSTTAAPATVTSVAITAASAFTAVGQQVQFTATASMSDGSTQSVTTQASWQSSNAGVLTVSSSGLATSVAEGDAKLTASYQSATAASDVNVRIQWILKGRIVSTADGSPVTGGAGIAIDGAQEISVASDGSYTIQGPGAPTSKSLTITAPGFVTRSTAVAINGTRTGVDLDLISLASPFSLNFYREILRGAADNSGLLQNSFRWEVPPSFYINIRNGSSEMPASVIDQLAGMIPAIVSQVTGGRLAAGRIESGTETRPITAGWINVDYTNAIGSCGLAAVGGNLVRINPICSCLGTVGIHEITHALGFWHHTQMGGLMSRVGPTQCSTGLSAIEAYHTKIAYSRPRGNRDPDSDPQGAKPLGDPNAGDRTLACWAIR